MTSWREKKENIRSYNGMESGKWKIPLPRLGSNSAMNKLHVNRNQMVLSAIEL